jgi:agmatinase
MPFYERHAPGYREHGRTLPDLSYLKGWAAQDAEAELGDAEWRKEVARGLALGLPAAGSIGDPDISCFQRGELPHWSGINTFLKLRRSIRLTTSSWGWTSGSR